MAARYLILAVALLLGHLSPASAGTGGQPVVIENVDRYRVMDAMFEGVRVVLAHRGEKVSPEYLQGISGSAFRIAGPCPCAPTCSGMMGPEELARLFGYEVEPVSLCGKGAQPEKDVVPLVARVKDEIRAGRPVLVWHAFTNAEWDVVCGFDEEKRHFLGRGSYAGLEAYATADETRTAKCLGICPALGVIFIGKKTGAFDARAAELASLEEAVRHARSAPQTPQSWGASEPDRSHPWRFQEGIACYDAWVRSFRSEPERVPGAGDRYPLGIYRSTHRAAAGFLQELAPKYPEARAFLKEGAGHFAAEADALDELHDKLLQGWQGWKAPDPEKSARAATLLATARRHYALGIESVEYALKAIDPARVAAAARPARVRRGKESALVEGVPELAWGRGKDCTYLGALEAALKHTRHPYTYSDLMGLSGLAFRVRWCNDETKTQWCPSCAVGELPDEGAALTRLTGWELPVEGVEPAARDHERLRRTVVASIDAGQPVLTYPEHFDMALVYGYEEGGKVLLLRDYHSGGTLRIPVEKLGPLQMYVGAHTATPPAPRALRAALETAVLNWRRGKHHGGLPDREYWYGDAALSAWVRDLRRFDALPEETREKLTRLSRWCAVTLRDARRAAVQFLKEWPTVVPGEPADALKRAAALYEEEAKLIEEVTWATPEGRAKGITMLEAAQGLERKAIVELEAALRCKELAALPPAPGATGRPVLLHDVIREIDDLPADGRFYNNRRTDLVYRAAFLRAEGIADVDYETLVMLAGHGTTFAYHPKDFGPLYSPPDDPGETEKRTARATGLAFEPLPKAKTPEEAWDAIKAAIDAGLPVLGSFLDPYVFAGYQDAERKEERRLFVMGGWGPPAWWTWGNLAKWVGEWGGLSGPAGEVERAPARETVTGVLKGVVRWAEGDGRAGVDWMAEAKFGFAGLEAFAADIADLEKKPGTWDRGWLGCHCVYRQATGRRCAALYLRRTAGDLPEGARPHALAAAEAYQAAWVAWCRFGEQLGQDTGLEGEDAPKRAWSDPARRKAGAAALREAITHERAAVEAIRRALEETWRR